MFQRTANFGKIPRIVLEARSVLRHTYKTTYMIRIVYPIKSSTNVRSRGHALSYVVMVDMLAAPNQKWDVQVAVLTRQCFGAEAKS
jgi:hypothetical protein